MESCLQVFLQTPQCCLGWMPWLKTQPFIQPSKSALMSVLFFTPGLAKMSYKYDVTWVHCRLYPCIWNCIAHSERCCTPGNLSVCVPTSFPVYMRTYSSFPSSTVVRELLWNTCIFPNINKDQDTAHLITSDVWYFKQLVITHKSCFIQKTRRWKNIFSSKKQRKLYYNLVSCTTVQKHFEHFHTVQTYLHASLHTHKKFSPSF